ncbi:Vacuolar protein sorting-associated protein 26, partial [Penicillium vulpinum]
FHTKTYQISAHGGGAGRRYYISHLQATATAPDHQSSDLLVRASIAAASITSAMASLFFSTPVDIDVVLEDLDERQTVDVKLDKGRRERVPLYMDGESVKGAVTVRPKDGKRLEHTGIKVQFIGTIEMFYDRGNHYEFLSLVQELAAPGELLHPQTFPFNFKNVEKQYESYNGINVKLRYFVRVTVSRRMADVIREKDLWVYSYRMPPENNSPIKMDVGIEDCLHIEFEYSKSKYHLKDVIVGRIYFLLVRLKIKHMELSIIRRETTGSPPNQYNESETLVRFEIMDGSPSRGETIPIRLFLGGFDLTPTFRDVNKKYSTRYYLSLVLIDEDARRYFKQSEIALYRQAPEIAPNAQIAQQQQIQQQMLLEQQRQQPALPPGSATAGPGREAAPLRQEPQPVPAPAA